MLCLDSMLFCFKPRNKSQDRGHRGPGARGRVLFDLIIHLKKASINKIPQSFLGLLEHFVHVKTYGMSYYFLRFILNTSCEYSSTGVVFQKWTLVLVLSLSLRTFVAVKSETDLCLYPVLFKIKGITSILSKKKRKLFLPAQWFV